MIKRIVLDFLYLFFALLLLYLLLMSMLPCLISHYLIKISSRQLLLLLNHLTWQFLHKYVRFLHHFLYDNFFLLLNYWLLIFLLFDLIFFLFRLFLLFNLFWLLFYFLLDFFYLIRFFLGLLLFILNLSLFFRLFTFFWLIKLFQKSLESLLEFNYSGSIKIAESYIFNRTRAIFNPFQTGFKHYIGTSIFWEPKYSTRNCWNWNRLTFQIFSHF